jgi:hypothetical protein
MCACVRACVCKLMWKGMSVYARWYYDGLTALLYDETKAIAWSSKWLPCYHRPIQQQKNKQKHLRTTQKTQRCAYTHLFERHETHSISPTDLFWSGCDAAAAPFRLHTAVSTDVIIVEITTACPCLDELLYLDDLNWIIGWHELDCGSNELDYSIEGIGLLNKMIWTFGYNELDPMRWIQQQEKQQRHTCCLLNLHI